ncbi:hypothetical protein [Paenibacillus silvae]|uniref:hypothetical protein n=1 Tax=Paenibacillus TaxID=44249 RepID=UPI003F4F1116
MNALPKLAVERVTLRQLRLEDAAELFEYFSKDEVTEFYDSSLVKRTFKGRDRL